MGAALRRVGKQAMISINAVEKLDWDNRTFRIVQNKRTDAGAGALNVMRSVATTLLNVFGTMGTFTLSAVEEYDPCSGSVTSAAPTTVKAKVYVEDLTSEQGQESAQMQANCQVYVAGAAFGYPNVALLTLQAVETGSTLKTIEVP